MKKIITTFIICVAMMLSTLGMTAFAATSGTLSSSLNRSYATLKLKNTSGNSRRCVVTIRETNSASYDSLSTVCTNAGNISSGNKISTSGMLSKSYARGFGYIYNSSSDSSGIAKTIYTEIR